MATWMASVLEDTDVLVFGELHGNAESPAAFKRMVCATLASADRALVGLELPESAVDVVRAQVGEAMSSAAATGSEFWSRAHDGRTSVAMFDLVEWLVHIEAAGRIQLLGIDMRVTGREPFGTTSGMHLRRVLSPAGEDARKILLLTGRGHSDFHGGGHSISEDLASHGIATLSVELMPTGGASWVCRFGRCGVSDAPRGECGVGGDVPGAYEERDVHRRRATLCLGPVTPSLPKVQ
ncbi:MULTISPECIES: hypothetical protein [unclassified Luteimonas]